MSNAVQLVYFLQRLAVGAITPVLSLMLIAHGATIETLSLLIGLYSITVVASEFPSGVLADVFGRKPAFLLSNLFALLCYGLVLVSQTVILLIPAVMLMGLSRAFSSGTLDALAVSQTQAKEDQALLKITSRFSMLESAGLATGALIGGLLASTSNRYSGNILFGIGLYSLICILTICLVHETKTTAVGSIRQPMQRLIRTQVRQSVAFIRQQGAIRAVLVLSVVTGFALITVETYWQPAYTAFHPPAFMLGMVTFGGFFGVMLGSKLIAWILKRYTQHVLPAYLLQRALFGLGLAGLYFTCGHFSFLGIYILSYGFLGGGSVAENTLIHRAAADDQRSSVLSLFSFILQLGGILAALAGYWVSANANYQLMFPLAGGLLVVSALYLFIPSIRHSKQQQP